MLAEGEVFLRGRKISTCVYREVHNVTYILGMDTVDDFSYGSHYTTTTPRILHFFACDFLYVSSSTLNSIAEVGVDDSGCLSPCSSSFFT